QPEGGLTFRSYLEQVKEQALAGYANQDYPFEELVEKVVKSRDMSRHPLFDTMFVLQNDELQEINLDQLQLITQSVESGVSKFDMTWTVAESEDGMIIAVEYCTDLYRRETVERMAQHYLQLIEAALSEPETELAKLSMLTVKETRQLTHEFNATDAPYPQEKTIQRLFEEQVERTPDHIAVVSETEQVTYRELNARANRLARKLRKLDVKADSRVGLLAERSVEMIAGILGILKAGGAYVPIDPSYPQERMAYMLDDSGCRWLVGDGNLLKKVTFAGEKLELRGAMLDGEEAGNLEAANDPHHLAYVIYTSGSTGQPKGVMVEHRNVVNVVDWFTKQYKLHEHKRIVLMTNYVFDPSVEQIFSTLLSGSKLYCVTVEVMGNRRSLLDYLTRNEIEMLNFTPSGLKELLLADTTIIPSLQHIISGGERLDEALKNSLLARGYSVWNHYGPTETTIDAVTAQCFADHQVLLGQPVQNTRVYVLNQTNQLQPAGVPGEICIAGAGVARGYLNREELTAEKFVADPFVPGGRMYRTGDLGRWLPDGNLEYLGRMDEQVKIRGYRIEPSEIESTLLQLMPVKEAAVVAIEDASGDKALCAYIVSEEELSIAELRARLGETMPAYMIPAYFIQLNQMPLTVSGKLDRKALPRPEAEALRGAVYVAPRTETEARIAEIWQEVLGIERVGVTD
ncbi:non-ribosomal peptide synthetase, partial [Paenibacillus xylaniclasticus]|uniref:non-ribosomal peptide synthetase n=1 Tax=Paenibacillus xylaniclasticus TaxID=588083 RepID=UPI000FD73C90